MRRPSSLFLAALVLASACSPAPPPRRPPLNACPLPWPEDTTYLMSGQAAFLLKSEISEAFRLQRIVLTVDGEIICSRTKDVNEPALNPDALPDLSGPL